MRLMTWNIAWFDRLFDDEGNLRQDAGSGGLAGASAAEQSRAVARILEEVDPDAVMVVEAPDTPPGQGQHPRRETARMLRRFARAYGLRTRHAISGFQSGTQQEIAFMYDRRALKAAHDPHGPFRSTAKAPRFDKAYRPDPEVLPQAAGDARDVHFSKPPLELAVTTASGKRLRIIGCHIKSKAPHGATSPADALRRKARNTRLQLAQCLWLRARIDQHLERGDSVIVMGDLNDGPGLDAQEEKLGLSAAELVMGEGREPALRLYDPHARAVLDGKKPPPVTARFYRPDLTDRPDGMFAPLLDYILISHSLQSARPRWHIADPDQVPDQALAAQLRLASDHYPVVLDIDL